MEKINLKGEALVVKFLVLASEPLGSMETHDGPFRRVSGRKIILVPDAL